MVHIGVPNKALVWFPLGFVNYSIVVVISFHMFNFMYFSVNSTQEFLILISPISLKSKSRYVHVCNI